MKKIYPGVLLPVWLGALAIGARTGGALLPAPARLLMEKSATIASTFKLTAKERRAIEQLLAEAAAQKGFNARMRSLSARLLGRPYLVAPLKGSFTEPEQFVARLDGFDCVTYVETVLALASAHDPDSFAERLRQIRYAGGEVSYATRLHYTTDWSKANITRGYLRDLTQGAGTVERSRVLNALPGFPPRRQSFRLFPKSALNGLSASLLDGDLVYFASTRAGLDTYHVGLIFRTGERVRLRHASRSQGKVVEQDLAEFLKTNRMAGFILTRPTATH